MTTTTNRYNLIRSLAIGLVIVSGLLGVAFVGAQETETTKGSIVSGDTEIEMPRGGKDVDGTPVDEPSDPSETKGDDDDGTPIDIEPTLDEGDPCAMPTTEWEIREIRNQMQSTWDLDAGTASVTNPTDCDYPFALKSFKVNNEDAQVGQTLYDADEKIVPAHSTRTFSVDLPSCRYQLDLIIFPGTGYTPAKLLRGQIKQSLPVCTDTGTPIAVTCDGAPNPAGINQTVTWISHVTGGNGSYTYAWVGNGSFPANQTGATVSASYHAAGQKNANVTVTSGTQTATATCSIQVQETPVPLTVSCDGAPNPAGLNQSVTWSSHVAGGDGSYTYSWTGNGSFPANQTGSSVVTSYHAAGQKNANVTVTSGTQMATASCSIQVQEQVNCDASARENIVSADGTPFNPWDMEEDIVVVNGVASVTVKNISDVCDYNVALSSYKTGVYVVGHEQEYINEQQLYDEDVHSGFLYNVGHGQTRTLRVDVPSCNYQLDLYTFVDGASPSPVPPDFARLTSTHTLLDWEQENSAGSCFIVSCPLVPPAITTASSAVGTVGTPFSHDITITGDNVNPITTGTLPAGLTFNHVSGSLWRISGTPTQAGTITFTISVTNECGSDDASITITIGGGSCPFTPPVITSPQTASGTVGSFFSYSITTTGNVSSLTVANLPAGLTFSGNTISGTPTQTGTFTAIITAGNQCAFTAINLTITIGGGSCPFTPPVITSPQTASGTVGSPFSYTITTTGTVSNLTVTTDTLPLGLNYQNGVISGTPTQAGTFIAIITASNQCGSTAINLTITIGGGSCPLTPPVITSPQTASGTVGSSFSYTITTTGTVSDLTVTNLPAGLSYSNSVISGTPTQTGTFTAIITASNRCASTAINLRITVNGGGDDDDDDNGDDDDDNGGGGGGGHRRRPNVVLFAEPEVLGASISLAQIPYTGLGTSIFQLTLFILGLLAISGGIIYTIMRRVRQSPASSVTVTAGPARTTVSIGDEVVDEPTLAAYEEYAYAAPAPRPVVKVAPVQTVRSEAPANIPVAVSFAGTPRPSQSAVSAVQKGTDVQTSTHVSAARIQNEARSSRTLISDDGAELIAGSAEGDEKKAIERLNQIVEIAKSRYPREDGWLILDKDRVRETLFISTLSMIPLFVEWIVRGEDKKVFTFLRMLKHQEQPVADFMRKVVSDLDNAYRARMEGSDERANVNQHIAEVTYHLSNKELETIVGELLHGVDERYDSAYTSVRLSLVRVLDIVKERALRSVGSAYAFADETVR